MRPMINMTHRRLVTPQSFVFPGVPDTSADESTDDQQKSFKWIWHVAELLDKLLDLWELIQPFLQRQISSFFAKANAIATRIATHCVARFGVNT